MEGKGSCTSNRIFVFVVRKGDGKVLNPVVLAFVGNDLFFESGQVSEPPDERKHLTQRYDVEQVSVHQPISTTPFPAWLTYAVA